MFCFVFRYQRRKGIIIHETSVVVYAQLLTGNRYQLNQNGEVYLEKQWSKQVLPFVYQTVVKVNIQVQYLLWIISDSDYVLTYLYKLCNYSTGTELYLRLPLLSLSCRISKPLILVFQASKLWMICFLLEVQPSCWDLLTMAAWEKLVPVIS